MPLQIPSPELIRLSWVNGDSLAVTIYMAMTFPYIMLIFRHYENVMYLMTNGHSVAWVLFPWVTQSPGT